MYRAREIGYRDVLSEFSVFFIGYRALVIDLRALLVECGARLIES